MLALLTIFISKSHKLLEKFKPILPVVNIQTAEMIMKTSTLVLIFDNIFSVMTTFWKDLKIGENFIRFFLSFQFPYFKNGGSWMASVVVVC